DDLMTELPSRCRAVRVSHASSSHVLKRPTAGRGGVVRRVDDLKSALVLSSAFGMAAAAALPLFLPSLPPEVPALPLPLPFFCARLAVQLVVVYGLLGFVGLRLERTRGFEPVPCLTAIWNPKSNRCGWSWAGGAFAIGTCCGALLVAAVNAIQRVVP